MTTRIEDYSVGQLARLSGVSVRTLHHYDDIGLLKPAHVDPNGYRRYGREELLRLQEILFYRDVGVSLSEVVRLLDEPKDRLSRLHRHRDRLQAQVHRTAEVIETLNTTIAHLEGKRDMDINELYKPFSAEKQAEYESWLVTTYGEEMAAAIATSKAAVEDLPHGAAGAMEQLKAIETELVCAYEADTAPGSDQLHPLLERHRDWIAKMWGRACEADGVEGLADLYRSHPDFVARYETLSPKFSDWLPTAMKAHADRLRHKS